MKNDIEAIVGSVAQRIAQGQNLVGIDYDKAEQVSKAMFQSKPESYRTIAAIAALVKQVSLRQPNNDITPKDLQGLGVVQKYEQIIATALNRARKVVKITGEYKPPSPTAPAASASEGGESGPQDAEPPPHAPLPASPSGEPGVEVLPPPPPLPAGPPAVPASEGGESGVEALPTPPPSPPGPQDAEPPHTPMPPPSGSATEPAPEDEGPAAPASEGEKSEEEPPKTPTPPSGSATEPAPENPPGPQNAEPPHTPTPPSGSATEPAPENSPEETQETEQKLSLCEKIKKHPRRSLSIIFAIGFTISTGTALVYWQRKRIYNWIKKI